MSKSLQESTASLLTAPGRGAVAVISVRGKDSLTTLTRCFKPANPDTKASQFRGRPVLGRWHSPGSELPAEELIVVIKSETDWEVHCHGGDQAAQRILVDLHAQGIRCVAPSKQRAVRNTADLAWQRLPDALTEKTAAILMAQARGALDQEFSTITTLVRNCRVEQAQARLRQLLRAAPIGMHLTKPWRVCVIGPPNVGKSYLVNTLLGFDRSIVYDMPGTTRDVLSTATAIDGWPVELIDTAGVHASRDELELMGIQGAADTMANVELVLAVTDVQSPTIDHEIEGMTDNKPCVHVINKRDLLDDRAIDALAEQWPDACVISAKFKKNIDRLFHLIGDRLTGCWPYEDALGDFPVPFLESHVVALNDAVNHLERGELGAASAIIDRLMHGQGASGAQFDD